MEATGHNDGAVERYLRIVGLRTGCPYCAAGIVWSFDSAARRLALPRSAVPVRYTGLAYAIWQDAYSRGKHNVSQVPHAHDLIDWRMDKGLNGHIGQIVSIGNRGWLTTLEYNTSSTNAGNQRDGGNDQSLHNGQSLRNDQSLRGGVFLKQRNYRHPLGKMRLRGFIGFTTF